MLKESLMTSRSITNVFKDPYQFFYNSNITRHDDVGNPSFFEHCRYFVMLWFYFPVFQHFLDLGYAGYCIDIPVAQIQMNNKYIILKTSMHRMIGLTWDHKAPKSFLVLIRIALKLDASWNKWERISRAFHGEILNLSYMQYGTVIIKQVSFHMEKFVNWCHWLQAKFSHL